MIPAAVLAAAAIAFLLALVLSPVFRRVASSFGHIDVPNERSSHVSPTPRSGGLAIGFGIAGAAASAGLAADPAVAAALIGAALLGAMALVDEHRALPRRGRLLVQIAVAVLVIVVGRLTAASAVGGGASLALGALAFVMAVVWVVGVVNVYNFMDGANGLAASQAIVAGIALALLMGAADPPAATFALIVAGAAAGFLPWNFPHASIFMGDTGSNCLGLAFAVLTVRAAADGIALPAIVLPLAPFLLDASVTVLIRVARGEAFFSTPHRLHFYQRLLDRGWTHPGVTAVWTALAIASSCAALAYPRVPPPAAWTLVAAVLLVHAAVASSILRTRPMIASCR